jgi:hypothetical protein
MPHGPLGLTQPARKKERRRLLAVADKRTVVDRPGLECPARLAFGVGRTAEAPQLAAEANGCRGIDLLAEAGDRRRRVR